VINTLLGPPFGSDPDHARDWTPTPAASECDPALELFSASCALNKFMQKLKQVPSGAEVGDVHIFQKGSREFETRCVTDHRVSPALWAKCRSIVIGPVFDAFRKKNLCAVKATCFAAALDLFVIID
jgi:hypothetical protein